MGFNKSLPFTNKRFEFIRGEGHSGEIRKTVFALDFVEHGKLNTRFEYLMRRLARKNGWFVPTSTLLDYLRARSPQSDINASQLAALERRWLLHKLRIGSS